MQAEGNNSHDCLMERDWPSEMKPEPKLVFGPERQLRRGRVYRFDDTGAGGFLIDSGNVTGIENL